MDLPSRSASIDPFLASSYDEIVILGTRTVVEINKDVNKVGKNSSKSPHNEDNSSVSQDASILSQVASIPSKSSIDPSIASKGSIDPLLASSDDEIVILGKVTVSEINKDVNKVGKNSSKSPHNEDNSSVSQGASKVDYSGDKLTTRMLMESLRANEYHIIEEKFPNHFCVISTQNASLPRVVRAKPDRDATEMTIFDVSCCNSV